MKVRYDKESDAAYIRMSSKKPEGAIEMAEGVIAFHSGTALQNGRYIASGGRVLGITALGKTVPDAIDKAYKAVREIKCDSLYYRTDIGKKALKYL